MRFRVFLLPVMVMWALSCAMAGMFLFAVQGIHNLTDARHSEANEFSPDLRYQ